MSCFGECNFSFFKVRMTSKISNLKVRFFKRFFKVVLQYCRVMSGTEHVAMAIYSVPVSLLFQVRYYHLRHKKAKYLVLSKTYAQTHLPLGLLLNIFSRMFYPV